MANDLKKFKYFKNEDVNRGFINRGIRHASGRFSQWLVPTSITPNQVTTVSFLFTLIAAFLLLTPVFWFSFLAGIAHLISFFLDYVDGSLARLKNMSSTFGAWFDGVKDNVSILILIAAFTAHSFFKTGEILFIVAGFSAALGFQTCKILFIIFKRTFAESGAIIEKQKKSFVSRAIFLNELFIYNWATVFMLLFLVEWFLAFLAIYSWLLYGAMLVVLTVKAKKLDVKQSRRKALKSKEL